jgi:Zinc finger protein
MDREGLDEAVDVFCVIGPYYPRLNVDELLWFIFRDAYLLTSVVIVGDTESDTLPELFIECVNARLCGRGVKRQKRTRTGRNTRNRAIVFPTLVSSNISSHHDPFLLTDWLSSSSLPPLYRRHVFSPGRRGAKDWRASLEATAQQQSAM